MVLDEAGPSCDALLHAYIVIYFAHGSEDNLYRAFVMQPCKLIVTLYNQKNLNYIAVYWKSFGHKLLLGLIIPKQFLCMNGLHNEYIPVAPLHICDKYNIMQ